MVDAVKAAARPPQSKTSALSSGKGRFADLGLEKMKALLLSKYRQLEMAEVPTPSAGAGDVLIRVGACGVCGSDVHGYDGSSGRRIPPIVMGDEAAGRIAAVGAGGTGLAQGDCGTFESAIYFV